MKKACCTLLCAVSLAATSSGAPAADITVDSGTLLGMARHDVSGASQQTLLPATQFLGLSADKLADGNLSLQLYGWGRFDLADNSYNNDKSAGSLTYGYLQYRFKQAGAVVRAGRLSVREGIVNEQLDGVSARTDLPFGFGLSAFGGATVHSAHISGENSDGKGDALYGGRANYRYGGLLEVGLSGVFESAAPTLATHTAGDYRRVGGDLWITPVKSVDIIGHSSYNPETQQFAEHGYLINVKPVQKLVLTGEINQYRDRNYLYAWTMFSAAALNPNDKSTSVGVSASYEVNKNLELSADYKHYNRELGSADRFGGMAKVNYRDNAIRGGLGYHYLNAGQGFAIGTNPSASYHELRCYLMQDSKSYFASADLLGEIFKEKIYGEGSAWEAAASLGYHFTPALALSGDLSYGRNPQFTEEVKALLRITYTTTYSGIGGEKMTISKQQLLIPALIGLIVIASCARMNSIPGLPASHPEALAVGQQVNCSECHEDQQKGTMKAFNSFSHTPSFVKGHRYYAASDDRLCATCHKASFCSDCHTVKTELKPSTRYGNRPDREFQHRGNYITMHKIEGKLDPASCYRCHGRANNDRCAACHK